jgi:hypothetical protein
MQYQHRINTGRAPLLHALGALAAATGAFRRQVNAGCAEPSKHIAPPHPTPNMALDLKPCSGRPASRLERQHPDRGCKFLAAIVASPIVADAAVKAEGRLLGNEQHRPAARATGATEIFDARRLARDFGIHDESSFAGPADMARVLRAPCGAVTTPR